MRSVFVTVPQGSRECLRLLEGTELKDKRALPAPSFSRYPSARATMTFEILPLAALSRPGNIAIAKELLRPDYLALTLGPIFYVLAEELAASGRLLSIELLFVVMALLALHTAVFMWNDYKDHLRGLDTYHQRGGSRVIQRGWLAAYQVKNLTLISIAVALLVSIPLLSHHWQNLWGVVVFVALSLIGFSLLPRSYRYHGVGDLLILTCLGPLLVFGLLQVLSPSQGFGIGQALAGLALGISAVGVFHLRQIEQMVMDHHSGKPTLILWLGFDRAKVLLVGEYLLIWALGSAFILGGKLSFATVILALLFLTQILLGIRSVYLAKSSLSSRLRGLRRVGLYLHWFLCLTLFAATFLQAAA